MDLKEAVAVARQQISDLFAADAPRDIRLENFLYDDHLMVWSLTIGFDLSDHAAAGFDVNPSGAQLQDCPGLGGR